MDTVSAHLLLSPIAVATRRSSAEGSYAEGSPAWLGTGFFYVSQNLAPGWAQETPELA